MESLIKLQKKDIYTKNKLLCLDIIYLQVIINIVILAKINEEK